MVAAPERAGELEGLSRELCAEIAGWRYENLPDDVIRTVKLFLLDTFGVVVGAARAPGIVEINRRVARWEKDGAATALIGKHRCSPPHAALVNGAAAHALDFDDIHDAARVHTFCVMLPTMLAAAEDIGGIDGKRFLLALAIGAELHARLGLAANNALGQGWHPTMIFGVLAGALGAGNLLGLDETGMLNALGLAAHQACGTAQPMHDGALAKRVGAGFAARGALTAAFLAADGITGPYRPLEGAAGMFPLLQRGEVDPDRLMDGLGERWHLRDYSFKPFPCCRCTHTTIGLGIELYERGVRPDDVAAVEIALAKVNHQIVGEPYQVERNSVVHAQFNVAYTFARALTHGAVDLAAFTQSSIADPKVVGLAEKVTVVVDLDEAPADMAPSRVTVTRTDGETVTVAGRLVPGSPQAPMTEAEIVAKLESCAAFGLGVDATAMIRLFAERVFALDEIPDVAELARDFPS